MNIYGWLQIILFLGIILALAKPLGSYMARALGGEKTFLHPVLDRWSGSSIASQG